MNNFNLHKARMMILPIALLTAGLLGTLFVVIKKKYCNA